jgi:hypothetical protein
MIRGDCYWYKLAGNVKMSVVFTFIFQNIVICQRTFSNCVDSHHAGDTSTDISPILSSITIDVWLLIHAVSISHTATNRSR